MIENKTHYKNPKKQHFMGTYSFPNMKDLILTIKAVVKEDVAMPATGEVEERNVCYFTESSELIKPLIIKDYNRETLEEMSGSPWLEDWAGLTVQIGIGKSKKTKNKYVPIIRAWKPKKDEKPRIDTDSLTWENIILGIKNGYKLEQVQQKYTLNKEQIKFIIECERQSKESANGN